MVRKSVDKDVVERVRRLAESHQGSEKKKERMRKFFKNLPDLDHRITAFGSRVRLLKTKKGGVAIKQPEFSAKRDIEMVEQSVDWINKRQHDLFVLLKPKAQVIGEYILMRRTRFPSLIEMIGSKPNQMGITERGKRHLRRLARKSGVSVEEMKEQLMTAHKTLKDVANESLGEISDVNYHHNELYARRNILVLGKKNGKFLFLPLLDPK